MADQMDSQVEFGWAFLAPVPSASWTAGQAAGATVGMLSTSSGDSCVPGVVLTGVTLVMAPPSHHETGESASGRYERLRHEATVAGFPLLSDDDLRAEIRERLGRLE